MTLTRMDVLVIFCIILATNESSKRTGRTVWNKKLVCRTKSGKRVVIIQINFHQASFSMCIHHTCRRICRCSIVLYCIVLFRLIIVISHSQVILFIDLYLHIIVMPFETNSNKTRLINWKCFCFVSFVMFYQNSLKQLIASIIYIVCVCVCRFC